MAVRMKRSRKTAAVLLALVVSAALLTGAIALAGCGKSSANPQAQKLIDEANGHLKKAAADIKSLSDFNKAYNSLINGGKINADTAAKVEAMLEKAKKSEQDALSEVKKAKETLSGVNSLSVSSDMKHYVNMKLDAIGEQEQLLTSELQAMDLRLEAIKDQKDGAALDTVLAVEKRISELEQESMQHARNASELNKEASTFYQEKKLGK